MGGSIAGVVGSVVGGAISGKGAKSAANTQAEGAIEAARIQQETAREAMAAQKEATAESRADLAPYRQAGDKGLDLVQSLLGINPNLRETMSFKDFAKGQWGGISAKPDTRKRQDAQYARYLAATKAHNAASNAKFKKTTPEQIMKLDPGYKFRLGEGNRSVEQSAAVQRGPGLSGATLKELTRFGSDYASDEFGKVFSRATNLAGQGLGAATGQAQFTQAGANANANLATGAGNAAANGIIGAANAGAAGSVASGNAWGNAANNIGQQFYLKQLLGGGSSSSGGGGGGGFTNLNAIDWGP